MITDTNRFNKWEVQPVQLVLSTLLTKLPTTSEENQDPMDAAHDNQDHDVTPLGAEGPLDLGLDS